MSLEVVTSIHDPRLEHYRNLKHTNFTRHSGRFIAEGLKLVRRLLASGLVVYSVLSGRKYFETLVRLVPEGVPLLVADDELVRELIGFNFHHGVLACAARPAGLRLADVDWTPPAVVAVCPDVQDPENLGSIARTCLALGVRSLALGYRAGDPYSRRVLRTSMGAVLRLPIAQSDRLADELRHLRDEFDVQLVGAVTTEVAQPLADAPSSPRMAILFGREGHGLADEWLSMCDRLLTIPMRSNVDSLNVSVAAGIVLHHFASRAVR